MKHLTTKNFTYAAVNEFAQKNKCKAHTNPCKAKVLLLACAFILTAGNLFCQQSYFAKNKELGFVVSSILNGKEYGNLYSTDKKKENLSDTSECLEVKGKFDGSVKDFNGVYMAKLILDNKVIETQILNTRKSFLFTLQKNRLYAVRVEKAGYISKTVSISTYTSEKSMNEKNEYAFNFETNLISESLYACFDDDDVDFPVALVSYNKACDCFEHNKEYTAALVNRMINALIFGI